MALKDLINQNRKRVFMNPQHFASQHTWNGTPFLCVVDEATAIDRKNKSTMTWDCDTRDKTIYVPVEDFPGEPMPGLHGWFDNMDTTIVQVNEDMGILTLTLASYIPGQLERTY